MKIITNGVGGVGGGFDKKKVEQKVCVEREEFGEEVIGQKSLAIYILFGGVFLCFVFLGSVFF